MKRIALFALACTWLAACEGPDPLGVAPAGVAPAFQTAPGPNYVLILSTSVTDGAASKEAQAAIAAGYNVEVATPLQWAAKTTSDFASYRALILGDPTCSTNAATSVGAAIANNAVWAPAVVGNVFINGTDPVFHYSQGGNTMVTAGVTFAAAAVTSTGGPKTGLYASLSCYYNGTAPNTPVPLLNNLSAIPAAMFTVKGVDCFSAVHIVATHPALGGMTDASLSNWNCSVHEAFDHWPADFEVLVIAVGTGGEFTASDGTVGTPYVLARGVTVISDIRLTPEKATNPVGTSHTLTATVTTDAPSPGTPVEGVVVTFTVEAGPNTGVTGTCTTNSSGQCTFTYTSNGVPGTDIIRARATVAGKLQTSNAASKTWEMVGPPATLLLEPPGATNTVGEKHCVTATVRDIFGNPVSGVTVFFSVGPSVPTTTFPSPSSGSGTTNANGQATFCYTASLPGVDRIHAFADVNSDRMEQPTEPSGNAEKTWTPPVSTALCEVKITDGGWIIANNLDRANFGGNAKVLPDETVQGQQEYQDQGPAQAMNVHSTEITATTCNSGRTTASIFGKATIDGAGSHVFRIDVTDGGSGGSNDTYGILLDNGYVSGQHPLGGGNVTIHNN